MPLALAAAAVLVFVSGAENARPQTADGSRIAGRQVVPDTTRHTASGEPAELPIRTPTEPGLAAGASMQHAIRDPWLGEDKAQHLAMSYAITTFGYSGLRAAGGGRDTSIALAAGCAVAAGIAKEVLDRRRGGIFSYRDLAADLIGAGAGILLLSAAR
jgi:uncharacterized protein YfiM (DUF2279 family)